MDKMIPIAKVGASYRLKGELKLYVLSDSIEQALSYGQWYVQKPNSNQWQLLHNESVNRLGDKLLIQFDGVVTKEDAACFTNALIGVPRDALQEAKEDEFYWVDLIGLNVINKEGESFGKVVNILETGANEVLCCQRGKKEYLIPFVHQYVLDVSLAKKEITVDWHFDY